MRGRTGTPHRRNDPAPSYLLLVALAFAGCVAFAEGASASSLTRSKGRLPQTAAATAAPLVEAAALLAVSRNQAAQARADVVEETVLEAEEFTTIVPENTTLRANFTGNPQIDYQFDPNLPRELNGKNLTDYPFYSLVPDNIDFKCDGLHDGFYANVEHKCQLYHHCLYGTRNDFICANYTAFDQRTFICHFVSEVDCVNSHKFWDRNEALYKPTTSSTTSTTSTTPSPPRETGGGRRGGGGRRRRPGRPRRPSYDEYEYDDEYDYYDDEPPARRPGKKRGRRPQNRHRDSDADEYDSPPPAPREKVAPATPTEEVPLPTKPNKAVFEKPRVVPRIRPPVPLSEREKYARPGEDATTEKPSRPSKRPAATEEYYDEDDDAPAPSRKNKKQQQEAADEDDADFRRMPPQGANGRPLRRNRGPNGRRRPSRPLYDDDEEDYREEARPMRKRPNRRPYADDYDDEPAPRSRKPARQRQREYDDDYEEERERRPAKKSTTTTTTTTTPKPTTTTTTTKKPKSTTPAYDDEEYYEDDYEDVAPPAPKKPQKVVDEPATSASMTSTTTTTAASTSSTTTTRRPFVPRPKPATPPPDTSMKFKLITGAEKEDAFEFSIDDYVKPTTRAPFIPRGSKAPVPTSSTTTTTTAAPKTRESLRQSSIKSREPVEEEEDDYDYNIKPVRVQQFQSRTPTKAPVEVIPSRAPIPARNKPSTDYSAEVEPKPVAPRFPPRSKPEFTSSDDEYRTIVSRKQEAKQPVPEYKTPSPPPRSRLPTSFLPRGLSPVGGARNKPTTAVPLYEDDEDEAFNDALHPTGADSSSTLRYSTLTQPQNRLPPIRGSQQRLQAEQPEVTAPSQSGFSRLPLYDDEDVDEQPTAPAARTSGQFQSRQQPSAYDSYQGRQQASSSSSASNSFRSRQPAQQRGRPALATAASTAQYQGWSRDYFYPTY